VNKLADKPFALIGVHGLGYEPQKLKDVMAKEKLNWRSIADPRVISVKWASRGTPAYYIFDHKGVIRYKWMGFPGGKALDSALEGLVKEAE
jgi:hypothetical protein